MSENNQLQTVLKEQGITGNHATELLEAFGAPFEEAGKIIAEYKTIEVTSEDQTEDMAKARRMRLALKDTRVEVEKKRKELKENSLKVGRAIDSVATFVKQNIEPAENYLLQQEKFAEIKQAERAAKLKADRTEKLMQYTNDISLYNLDNMNDEQFNSLLATLKAQHEAKLAEEKRLEDERKAKEEADRKAIEEQAKENARLKAEAEARALKEKKEREEREAKEAAAKAEQDKKDAEAKAEQDRIKAEAEAKIEAERKKTEALEQEKREREAEEKRKQDEAAEQERKALLAPDRKKLNDFADMLGVITAPAVKSNKAQEVINYIEKELTRLSNYLNEKAKEL